MLIRERILKSDDDGAASGSLDRECGYLHGHLAKMTFA
jgi:hypothetical protein